MIDFSDIDGRDVRKKYCGTCNYCPENGRLMTPDNPAKELWGQVQQKKRELREMPMHRCHTNPNFVCFGSAHNRHMNHNQIMIVLEKKMFTSRYFSCQEEPVLSSKWTEEV